MINGNKGRGDMRMLSIRKFYFKNPRFSSFFWVCFQFSLLPFVLFPCLCQLLARPVRFDRPPSKARHGTEAADDATRAIASVEKEGGEGEEEKKRFNNSQ